MQVTVSNLYASNIIFYENSNQWLIYTIKLSIIQRVPLAIPNKYDQRIKTSNTHINESNNFNITGCEAEDKLSRT